MRLRMFGTADQAALAAARTIVRQLRMRPDSVLGLPTGRTAAPMYAALARLAPDFSRAHTFNLDEFIGLSPHDPRSFRAFMDRHLFRHINIAPRHVHFLRGDAADPVEECARFERALSAAGGIDLLTLGIGRNGHIGFNEPGRALFARTHRARLAPSTRRANAAAFGGRASDVPAEAMSMGMGTILTAASIVLIATGRSKAPAIRRMLNGCVTTRVPASFLQLHRDVTLILDRAAADGL
jgi:glucosamine-6-phosphate deaminase